MIAEDGEAIPRTIKYIHPTEDFSPRFSFGPDFSNLTAVTVSGNLNASVRLANRRPLSTAYEMVFDQEFVGGPVNFLAHKISAGFARMLTGR
ncbi:MAG: hypothetical protein WA952_17865 [Lewinella sp.]